MNAAEFLNISEKNIEKFEKLLNDPDANMRSLALSMINKVKGDKFSTQLKKIFLSDPAFSVRLHALMCLSANDGDDFYDVLKAGANDPYEAIRRYSASLMGEVGREDFIPSLVKLMMTDESSRVSFSAKNSLCRINPLKALEYVTAFIDNMPEQADKVKLKTMLTSQFKHENSQLFNELIANVKSDTASLKARLRDMKTFRGYNYKQAVASMLEILGSDKKENELRIMTAEALGWYTLYFDKSKIIDVCLKESENKANSETLRAETLKTVNRLKAGLNNPLIP
jgi:HEAT repeat protein